MSGETQLPSFIPAPQGRLRHRRTTNGQEPLVSPLNDDRSGGLNLVDIVGILQRHKKGLIIPTLLITAAVFVALHYVSPRYTAQTRLLINGSNPTPTEMAPVSAGLSVNDRSIASSERFIFTSHGLLSDVIDELELDKLKEFNPLLSRPETEDTELTKGQVRSRVVSELAKKIQIDNEPDSRVISIQATSNDPQTSAAIADLIAEKYLEQQIELKLSTAERVNKWLLSRVEELREDVNNADDAIEAYRQRSELQPDVLVLINEQISELSTQLLSARSDRITAEAQIDSETKILESSFINSLKSEEASIRGEIAKLAEKYGELHPSIVQRNAELFRLQQEISSESNKITNNVANEVIVASQREQNLETELANLKLRFSEAKQKEIGLRELEQEGDASRELLAAFLVRQKEVHLQSDESIQVADARVISFAGVPHSKTFPKILPITALAFVASLFISVIGVFIAEQFRSGFRSVKHVSDETGLPVLGLIPQQKKNKSVHQLVGNLRDSHFCESFRTLQLRLDLYETHEKHRAKGKTFLVTSMYPGDGKTSVVSCLAMSLRRSGNKVLLIDGDLRKPCLHTIFDINVNTSSGITSTVWGMVQPVGDSSVHNRIDVIPANSAGLMHPHDALRSSAFTQLLQHVKSHYDIIIVDSPPLRAVDDAVLISKVVDSTLFVMPWEQVSREAINSGIRNLGSGSVEGIVITKIDPEAHDQQAYGDTRRYRKALSTYNRTAN